MSLKGRSFSLQRDFQKQTLFSYDEFFSEMRQQNVEHLGQLELAPALLESDGILSLLYYER